MLYYLDNSYTIEYAMQNSDLMKIMIIERKM